MSDEVIQPTSGSLSEPPVIPIQEPQPAETPVTSVGISKVEKWLKGLGRLGQQILVVVAAAFIVLLVVRLFVGNPKEYKAANKDIKSISVKIDSIKMQQDTFKLQIKDLTAASRAYLEFIDKNNSLIEQNNQKLDKLNKAYHEKINSINHFSINDLDSFFRTKYSRYYDHTP